jgi:hypothetical protein
MIINKKLYLIRRNDTRWLRFTLGLKEKHNNRCQKCGKRTDRENYRWIVVHHKYYLEDRDPWDYPEDACQVICNYCHNAIDHDSIPRYQNPNVEELMEFPFIITKVFVRKGVSEEIPYNKYFDIKYYGRIIDCGYQTRHRQGDGRFDYELIVRELMNGETAFSDRTTGEPDNSSFNGALLPEYCI